MLYILIGYYSHDNFADKEFIHGTFSDKAQAEGFKKILNAKYKDNNTFTSMGQFAYSDIEEVELNKFVLDA